MTAESASRYAIEAIRFHKQEPIEELTRFASQAVEDYKEKLKENVAVFRKIAAENKMQTGAGTLSSSHFNGRIGMCGEILKLIDSIK